jgi:ELWxxDGT repeat protein
MRWFAALCTLWFGTAHAGTAITRIANLNTTPGQHYALGVNGLVLNGLTFFAHADVATGQELWVTDGTSAGTHLFLDLLPGPLSSRAEPLWVVNGKLVFDADDGEHGRELWVTDGTPAGTSLLLDVYPGPKGGFEQAYEAGGGLGLFRANDGEHGDELWATDGTPGGTRLFVDLNPNGSSYVNQVVYTAGQWFFIGNDGSGIYQLYGTDGGSSGLHRITNQTTSPGNQINNLSVLNNLVLFSGNNGTDGLEPWVSDGTTAGTQQLGDFTPGTLGSYPTRAIAFGAQAIELLTNPPAGVAVTDGTPAGTRRIATLAQVPQTFSSAPVAARQGSLVYFTGAATTGDFELWVTDGSDAGTRLVKDVNPGDGGAGIQAISPLSNGVFFMASDGTGVLEPWFSDGSAGGTQRLLALNPDGGTVSSQQVGPLGDGGVLFVLRNPSSAEELWVTFGSASNTRKVFSWSVEPDSSEPFQLFSVDGGVAFFGLRDGIIAFFTSDGTAAGTRAWPEAQYLSQPTAWRGGMTVGCDQRDSGEETCLVDDVSSGPRLVADIMPGPNGTYPFEAVTGASGRLFFRGIYGGWAIVTELADGGWGGKSCGFGSLVTPPLLPLGDRLISHEILGFTPGEITCITDGTDAGTWSLPGPFPQEGAQLGDRLLVSANASLGDELYVTDGSPSGFVLASDIVPGAKSSGPTQLVRAGGAIYFVATDPAHGAELWKWDGTTTSLVKDIRPGPVGSAPSSLTVIDDQLFFAADDGVTGREPWTSDGTSAGTARLTDLRPGPEGSYPQSFVKYAQDAIVFAADDGTTGREPWTVRATGEIVQLGDVVPGPQGSDPGNFVWSAGKLFFVARDALGDAEPYVAVEIDGGFTDGGQTDGGLSQNSDGGTSDPGPRKYTVACGCNQTSGTALLLLALVLLRRRQ